MLSCHNSTVLIAIYDSGEDYRKTAKQYFAHLACKRTFWASENSRINRVLRQPRNHPFRELRS